MSANVTLLASLRAWATNVIRRVRSKTPESLTERDAIIASGLFDANWYAAEAGQRFSSLGEAVDHYLTVGHTYRYSPNPLLDHVPPEPTESSLTPLGRFALRASPADRAPHPAWSAPRHAKSHPEALEQRYGPLGHLYADFGPDSVLFLRGPDQLKRVRWKNVEGPWRDLATTWTSQRRRLLSAWFDELPPAHGASSWPASTPQPDVMVTVVIATWNRAHMLTSALESVQAQTWTNWEVLVIDDGSTDNTALLVQAMAAEDPRIRLISRPHEGVCAARNRGIAEARGELTAFLDSDNTWRPDFVRHMVLSMHHDRLDAAYATLAAESPAGQRYQALQVTKADLEVANHVDLNILVVRTATLRRIGGFDPLLRRGVDYDLVLRLLGVTDLIHVPVVGADYNNDKSRTDRISVHESVAWIDAVRLKHLVNWRELNQTRRDRHLLSVVLPTGWRPGQTVERVMTARAELGAAPWEMVIVDHSDTRETFDRLLPILLTDSRIRYERLPAPHSFAFTANLGFSKTRGDHVMFLDFDTRPDPGTIAALAAATRNHGGSHLVEPAPPADGPAGRTFAIRAADFIAVRGLQPLLYNEFEVADLRHRLRDAMPSVGCDLLAEATVTRLSTMRNPARHDDNLRQFVELHGHQPSEDLQRL